MKNCQTKTKKCATIFSILIATICILTCICMVMPPIKQHKTASAEEIFYLRSPTLVLANSTDIFCYDSYTKSIINYSATLNSNGKADLKETYPLNKLVTEMCLTTSKLYYLSDGTLYYRQLTDLSTEKQMQCNAKILDFALIGETYLYLVCEDVDPSQTYLIYHTITSEDKINAGSRLNTDNTLQGCYLQQIEAYGEKIYAVVNNSKIYEISQPDASMTYTATETFNAKDTSDPDDPSEIVYLSKSSSGIQVLYTTPSNNIIVTKMTDSTGSTVKTIANYPLTSFYSVTPTKTYYCDTINQSVWLKDGSKQLQEIISNTSPTPTIAEISSHIYITLSADANIYAEPFSVTPIKQLSNGTHLTILTENDSFFSDYYYCIYTANGQNYYVYLPKSAQFTTQNKTTANINAKAIGSANKNIYSLPSTKKDDNNTIISTIDAEAIVTQIMVQTVLNDNEESFYLVKTQDGKIGYITTNQVSTNYASTKQEKIKCDAKTRRQTTIYITDISTADYTEAELKELELIELNKNTRVKLNETLNSTKKYTKITYQNDKNETFTGYVLTADIDPDGLTVMQILGLTLVLINIVILVVILIIRKKINDTKTTTLMR